LLIMVSTPFLSFEEARKQIIGRNFTFETPYGKRLLTYADYTASGRSLRFIEQFLIKIQREYANTHTEDDITGRNMTTMLHQAEQIIKKAFNAEKNCHIIAIGTGATGAISKLQEILGVRNLPAIKFFLKRIKDKIYEEFEELVEYRKFYEDELEKRKPIVFIGPYEHHSNDIIWRDSLAQLVRIELTNEGEINLEDLEKKLSNPSFQNRLKIGSFSAASNVTGLKSPIYEIARIMHKYNGIACFDYAASAPYVKIDMNRDKESYLDAVCLSPHKFIGGPGSSGILIFNERIYEKSISPTCAGGGTVDFVSNSSVDFVKDIETREKAGTPGILQTIKAALVIDLKDAIGIGKIEEKELEFTKKALNEFSKHPNIEILGPLDPNKRIAIISFMIKHEDKYLHPKFITKLLNDLFGIQSRAGCMCAGPYGHLLLQIDEETSEKYRNLIQQGIIGLKPGWCRINYHYLFSEIEFEFITKAIQFIVDKGFIFIPEYVFNYQTGEWHHHRFNEIEEVEKFSVRSILKMKLKDCFEEASIENREEIYNNYLQEAEKIAHSLQVKTSNYGKFKDPFVESLRWFNFIHITNED
jgi:selenocysteine lyase/cysteine desulfurase